MKNKFITENLLKDFKDNLDKNKSKKVSNILNNKSILQASYNSKTYNSISHNFEVDLIGLPVENQKKSGRCWLFAATNLLREQIAKKLNLEDFSLSNAYLAFWDKVERCNFFFEAIIKNIDKEVTDRLVQHFLNLGLEDGGQWDMAVNLINKYGIVPNSAMHDHYHAGDSQQINYLLNWKLRDGAAILRSQKDKSIENLNSVKEKLMLEIFKILETFYGTPPQKFNFEYTVELKQQSEYANSYKDLSRKYIVDKNLTPLEFYAKYIDTKIDEYVSIIHAPQHNKVMNQKYDFEYLNNVVEGKKITHINLEYPLFSYLIANELNNKRPVWFGSDVSWYFDRENGFWDDRTFEVDKLLDTNLEIEKGLMLSYKISCMTHAMLLMGVNLNSDKLNDISNKIDSNAINYEQFKNEMNNLEIDRWKVENSWGTSIGDWGYYVISDSWFNKYVYQAVIKKDELQKTLKLFFDSNYDNIETTTLEPWDEIGTLAK